MAEVLNRDYGLTNNIDPMGRKWVPVKVNGEQGLWQVGIQKDDTLLRYTGNLPDYLAGSFTTKDKIQPLIERMLSELWDKSDEATAAAAKNRAYKEARAQA